MSVVTSGVLPDELLSLLTAGQPTFAIDPACQGGLVLVGRFFNDLLLPGAGLTVATSFQCSNVQIVGEVKIAPVVGLEAITTAQEQRFGGIEQLQRILQQPDQPTRACLMVTLLCRRFGLAVAKQIPFNHVAPLVAVDESCIDQAWDTYEGNLVKLASSGRMTDEAHLRWQRQQSRPLEPTADHAKPASSLLNRLNLFKPLNRSSLSPKGG